MQVPFVLIQVYLLLYTHGVDSVYIHLQAFNEVHVTPQHSMFVRHKKLVSAVTIQAFQKKMLLCHKFTTYYGWFSFKGNIKVNDYKLEKILL